MVCGSCSDAGVRETIETVDGGIDSIGEEFATEYYNRTPRSGRARFYDDKSKFVLLQFGRGPDFTAQGVDQIARLEARVKSFRDEECAALNVRSVDTILVKPDWLAVLAICELVRGPGDEEQPSSRTFVQSTVVRYAASSAKKFVVVGTVFMFDDKTVDNVFAPETPPPQLLPVDTVTEHIATDRNDDDSGDPNGNTASMAPADPRVEKVENTATVRQPATAPIKKKAAKKGSIESHIDGGKKQDDTSVIVPVKLKMKQKPPAEKQPAANLKNPPPKEPTSNPTDVNKTNMDGAVLTTDSQTKQTSSNKKKPIVTEQIPTCSIGKSKVSNEHVSVKGTSKSSTGKKKGSVKDNSPVDVVAELYVGRIPKNIKIDQLNETFGKFGKLISANIYEAPGKKAQPNRQNYGIIQYEESETVDLVARFGTVALGNGDTVIVEKSKRNQQPNTKSH